jgi:putative nucleotidyltransferase with HDIG domain
MFSNFSIRDSHNKNLHNYLNILLKFVPTFFYSLKNFFKNLKNNEIYWNIAYTFFISFGLFLLNYFLLFNVYDIKKVARFDIIADKDLFISGYTYETLEKLKKISQIKEYYIDIRKTQKNIYNIDQFFLPQIKKDTNKLKRYFNEVESNLILSIKSEYVEYSYNSIKGYLILKLQNGVEFNDIPKVIDEIDGILDISRLSGDPKEIQKLNAYKKIILKKISNLIIFNKIFDIQKTLEAQREYLKNIPTHFEIKKGEIVVPKKALINPELLNIIKKMGLDQKFYKIQFYYLVIYSVIVFVLNILLLFLFNKLFAKNEEYDYLFDLNLKFFIITSIFINLVVVIKFYFDSVYFIFPFLLFCFIIYYIIGIRFAWVYFGIILVLLELLNYLYYQEMLNISFIVPFIVSSILFFIIFTNDNNEDFLSYSLFNQFLVFFLLSIIVFVLFNFNNPVNVLWWVISVILVFGLGNFIIIYLGKGLGGISYYKLRELLDLNNELLTMLRERALGTFNHSVRVSELCENCAKAINANPLLVKLGALYHDIGKIDKPNYFAENLEEGQENPHDKIEPHLSALIIKNHVKKGFEIANRYKLPKKLIDFIRTHHGTTIIWYFYTKALQKAKENKKYEIDINDYKYDGPKPYTKEMVILMICDSIEAASRSLNEISFNSIYKLTESIINRLLNEDQFSDSNITLNDINIIKQEVIKYLLISYHKRISYPAFKKSN